MSDAPDDSSGHPSERGGARRTTRVGDSGSPVGSTLSIILAVAAVVAGFLILRAITDDDTAADDGGIEVPDGTEVTVPESIDPGLVTTPTAVVPTAPAGPVYSGATIVVANASGVGGSAGSMSLGAHHAGLPGRG